jgi:CheY-like chemotaxis protein
MQRVRLFLAEDNPLDVEWLRSVLDRMGIEYDLTVVTDGEQAVDFLLQRGEYAGAPEPDLVILDLNLPKVKGVEVLQTVTRSKDLPVCIVTGSTEEREILKKKFGIRRIAYLVKPVDRDRILNTFRAYEHLRPLAEELASR